MRLTALPIATLAAFLAASTLACSALTSFDNFVGRATANGDGPLDEGGASTPPGTPPTTSPGDGGTGDGGDGGVVTPCSPEATPVTSGRVATGQWTGVTSALTADGIEASSGGLDPYDNDESDILTISDFGFAIPAGSSILGVEVVVTRSTDGDDMRDEVVRIGGSTLSRSVADDDEWPLGVSTQRYGGVLSQWALTLTPDEVNAASFRVMFKAKNHGSVEATAKVDAIGVMIDYCVR